MSQDPPRETPFTQEHEKLEARMVPFAGWKMPMQYKGIMAEHRSVREKVGLFDVSHMGRVEVRGAGALAQIQRWITNDAAQLTDYQALYTPICYPSGGIVDDCLVYRLAEDHFILVVNAANRQKDYEWLRDNKTDDSVVLEHPDQGDKWGLLALQGPQARSLLARLTDLDLQPLERNDLRRATVAGIEDCLVACTGYTGEDGFEIFVPDKGGATLWAALFEEGEKDGLAPCGLGARDTLRLEMKYPLYGNDIDQDTTPIEAGLSWTVKPDKGDFLGKEAILPQLQSKPPRRFIGFEMLERGIPRAGYSILANDQTIGKVTSGGHAPSLNKAIGVGYVPAKPQFAKIGSQFLIDCRGKQIAARVVKTPFYRPQ